MSLGQSGDVSSNIQRYRNYIIELSKGLDEGEVHAEELDLDDLVSQEQRSQQQQLQEEQSSRINGRFHRGSGHFNSKVKDSMIEQDCHQTARSYQESDSGESSHDDEEACAPKKTSSPSHYSHNYSSNSLESYHSPKNNFFIPSHIKLNPRANLYLLIVLTFTITISSLAVGNVESITTSRSPREHAALFFSSSSLIIALAVGCGFRYAPMRVYITQPYSNSLYERILGQFLDSREKGCGIMLLLSTLIVCGLVMQPTANLAVTSTSVRTSSTYQVLNSSLFYSTWVSVYTCVIVIADLFTLEASRWIIARDCGGDCGVVPTTYHPSFRSSALKMWAVTLFSDFAMSGTMLSLFSSGMRENQTKVMIAGILGVCGGLISAGVLALHHVVAVAQDRADTYGTTLTCWEGPNSQRHLVYVGTFLAIIVLLFNCTSVGLISFQSSRLGGIVLPCWMALFVSILLCKTYIDSFFVQPQKKKQNNDMFSDSVRSKRTHTTTSGESCTTLAELNKYESDRRRSHLDLMDRLKAFSAHFDNEEEEMCSSGSHTTPRQEPEGEVYSHPAPYKRTQSDQDSDGELTVDSNDQGDRKRKASRSPCKSPIRKSHNQHNNGNDQTAVDELVVNALKYARRTNEMAGHAEPDESSIDHILQLHQQYTKCSGGKQRRACFSKDELSHLIDKIGKERGSNNNTPRTSIRQINEENCKHPYGHRSPIKKDLRCQA